GDTTRGYQRRKPDRDAKPADVGDHGAAERIPLYPQRAQVEPEVVVQEAHQTQRPWHQRGWDARQALLCRLDVRVVTAADAGRLLGNGLGDLYDRGSIGLTNLDTGQVGVAATRHRHLEEDIRAASLPG